MFGLNRVADNSVDRDVGCTLACMERDKLNLFRCYKNCRQDIDVESKHSVTLKKVQSNETIRLLRRDHNSITIEVETDLLKQNNKTEISNLNDRTVYSRELYLVKIKTVYKDSPDIFHQWPHINEKPIFRFEMLAVNQSFSFAATIFAWNPTAAKGENVEYRDLPNVEVFQTLPHEYFKTLNNKSFSVDYSSNNDSSKLITTIHWNYLDDDIPFYLLRLYGTAAYSFSRTYRIKEFNQLHTLETDLLEYDSEYVIGIIDLSIFYEKKVYTFNTPSCLDIHQNNSERCQPLPSRNFRSIIHKDHYRIDVT